MMATAQLDLTGRLGLAPTFFGDINELTATPNRRYLGADGQVADGIYDPFRLDGYLVPANNTYADLSGTITAEFISRVYASSVDTIYLAQNGLKYSTVAGLDGTSITSTTLLTGTSQFRDMELYQINGEEAIFFTYKNLNTAVSSAQNINLGWMTVDPSKGAFQISSRVAEQLPNNDQGKQKISSADMQKLAQRFNVGDFQTGVSAYVTGVRVNLQIPYVGTTQVWTLRIGIQDDSSGRPSGSFLANGYVDVDPNTVTFGAFGEVYVQFPATLSLTINANYHIVVQPTVFGDLGTNEGVWWLCSTNDQTLYSNGLAETSVDGTNWVTVTSESYDFAVILNSYSNAGDTLPTPFVAVGTTANATGTGTTLTFNHITDSADNAVIVLGLQTTTASDVVTAVTCNGVAFTLVNGPLVRGATSTYQYVIQGVPLGTNVISITLSGSNTMYAMSAAYYGIQQIGNAYNSSGSGSGTSGPTLSITNTTTVDNQIVVALVYTASAVPTIAGSSCTERVFSSANTSLKMFDTNGPVTAGSHDFSFTMVPDSTKNYAKLHLVPANASQSPNIPAITESRDDSDFLQKADNGFLYWFTNSRVHRFDGGYPSGGDFGIFTPDVLNFPEYFTVIDAFDTNSLMYIGVQTSESDIPDYRTFGADTMGVYVWDRVSSVASMRNWIPIYGAREIKKIFVNAEGDLRVITIGEDRFTEIRAVQSGRLVVIRRLGMTSYPRYRDSFDFVNNMATWLGVDGIIYALGTTASRTSEQLYKIGAINGEVAATLTSGLLLAGNEESTQSREGVFLSWLDSATPTLSKWLPHGTGTVSAVAQKGNQGNVYSLVYEFPSLIWLNWVHLYCLPIPDDGAGNTTQVATVKVYLNKSTTVASTFNITRKELLKGYVYLPLDKKDVFAVQFEVEWSTSQTTGTYDFTPSRAALTYNETVHRLK